MIAENNGNQSIFVKYVARKDRIAEKLAFISDPNNTLLNENNREDVSRYVKGFVSFHYNFNFPNFYHEK